RVGLARAQQVAQEGRLVRRGDVRVERDDVWRDGLEERAPGVGARQRERDRELPAEAPDELLRQVEVELISAAHLQEGQQQHDAALGAHWTSSMSVSACPRQVRPWSSTQKPA